jgi:hypothetical protein
VRERAQGIMASATGAIPSCCTRKQPGAGLVRFCHDSQPGEAVAKFRPVFLSAAAVSIKPKAR